MTFNLKLRSTMLAALLVVCLPACEEKVEIRQQRFPILQTNEVTYTPATGIRFNGQVLRMGTDPVVDFGFIWMIEPIAGYPQSDTFKLSLGSQLTTNFFKNTGVNFTQGFNYEARAYILTTHNLCYGNRVLFKRK